MAAPARWKLLTALWTVYLVWGSTYLAIKLSVRTLPAFLSAGSRFLLAGGLLALILWLKGRSIRVTRRELASSALLGLALLGLGVGLVTLAETRIDSSVAAMIAGTVPLQVILLRTIARERVALATRLSVLVGLAGLALIVIPGGGGSFERDRPGDRRRRDHLLVARLLLRTPAAAPRRRLRRDHLGDAQRRRLPARARRRHRRALDDGRGRLQPRVDRGLALSRHRRLADRLHRVRVAAAERADLAGRDAPVREPAGRDRARRAAPGRAADARGRARRGADRRLGLRRRPAGRSRKGCRETRSRR